MKIEVGKHYIARRDGVIDGGNYTFYIAFCVGGRGKSREGRRYYLGIKSDPSDGWSHVSLGEGTAFWFNQEGVSLEEGAERFHIKRKSRSKSANDAPDYCDFLLCETQDVFFIDAAERSETEEMLRQDALKRKMRILAEWQRKRDLKETGGRIVFDMFVDREKIEWQFSGPVAKSDYDSLCKHNTMLEMATMLGAPAGTVIGIRHVPVSEAEAAAHGDSHE